MECHVRFSYIMRYGFNKFPKCRSKSNASKFTITRVAGIILTIHKLNVTIYQILFHSNTWLNSFMIDNKIILDALWLHQSFILIPMLFIKSIQIFIYLFLSVIYMQITKHKYKIRFNLPESRIFVLW